MSILDSANEQKEFMNDLTNYLSKRTNRSLVFKEARGKNRGMYHILSPDFFYYQRSAKDGHKSRYTSGYFVEFNKSENYISVGVRTEHSHAMMRLLSENLKSTELKKCFVGLKKLKSELVKKKIAPIEGVRSYTCFPNKHEFKKSKGKYPYFETYIHGFTNYPERLDFDELLKNMIVSKMKNTYTKTTQAPARGSKFHMCIEYFPLKNGYRASSVYFLADHFLPIFLNLFPKTLPAKRSSKLRGKLITLYKEKNLRLNCAFKRCKIDGKENLQAAHIIPDSKGGSDDSSNGIFLCKDHHCVQEGKPKRWLKANIKTSIGKKLDLT